MLGYEYPTLSFFLGDSWCQVEAARKIQEDSDLLKQSLNLSFSRKVESSTFFIRKEIMRLSAKLGMNAPKK